MKNYIKKLFFIALSVIIVNSIAITNVFASETHTEGEYSIIYASDNELIEPFAEIYCSSSPNYKHQMYSRGVGTLVQGSSNVIFRYGCAWQCPYCYTVAVTEGDPAAGRPIGRYATAAYGSTTGTAGTTLYVNTYWNTSSSTLTGFDFRYN